MAAKKTPEPAGDFLPGAESPHYLDGIRARGPQ